jgi:hypothetical protein
MDPCIGVGVVQPCPKLVQLDDTFVEDALGRGHKLSVIDGIDDEDGPPGSIHQALTMGCPDGRRRTTAAAVMLQSYSSAIKTDPA